MNLSGVFAPSPVLKTFKINSASQKSFLYYATPERIPTPFPSSLTTSRKLFKLEQTQNFSGYPCENLGLPCYNKSKISFFVNAEKNGGGRTESGLDKAEEDARGQSTMPDRFRPLAKEAPDKPIRWPLYIALPFALYTWRTVLWELSNWKKAVAAIFRFIRFISKLLLARVFQFVGDPVTSLIRSIETTFYTVRACYSWIIAYAPIQELTTIIILSSVILAISEAIVPDSVNSQPYILTLAGLIGFAAVGSYITELFFWLLLVGLFSFNRFVKKRDYLSSALPVAAVLAAVGEPWVRILVMASYLALAINQHSNKPSDSKEDNSNGVVKRVPIPLYLAATAIGIRLAAKWAGTRHLTWMIV